MIEIFKDEGISGAKANEDEMSIERDGLLDMLASLKENKIQYIVVLSTNRLWRSDLVKVLLHRELKRTMWISEQSTDRIILSTRKIPMRFL